MRGVTGGAFAAGNGTVQANRPFDFPGDIAQRFRARVVVLPVAGEAKLLFVRHQQGPGFSGVHPVADAAGFCTENRRMPDFRAAAGGDLGVAIEAEIRHSGFQQVSVPGFAVVRCMARQAAAGCRR